MAKKKDENLCPLCGDFMIAVCTGFRRLPFIDGRTYNYICDCCRNVPKTCEFVDGDWVMCEYGSKLRTPEEMMSDGWNKEQSNRSVKAVKAAIKNKKN